MPITLDQYLVSLGFSVDQAALRKFRDALDSAGKAVEGATGKYVGQLIKWQTIATGVFASIGASVVGLAEHVAMQDQEYRLLGLRMASTQAHAKSLKIAMDALGQPLEVIAWDPESHARFLQLIEDQKALQAGLGDPKVFEARMRTIRDIIGEVNRFKVEVNYISQGVVSKLFESFGTSMEDVLVKMQGWNDWIDHNLPKISEEIDKYLTPVLRQTIEVFKDLGGVLNEAGVLFLNLTSLLSGDDTFGATEVSVDKISKAFLYWLGVLERILTVITAIEHAAASLANMLAMLTQGRWGDLKDKIGGISAANDAANQIVLERFKNDFDKDGKLKLDGNSSGDGKPSDGSVLDMFKRDLASGTFSGSRGINNNNPGNMEYGPFAQGEGAIGREAKGRFAMFATADAGLKAMADLIRNKAQAGKTTIADLIESWSPSKENGATNTNAYIKDVAAQMGIGRDARTNFLDPSVMASAMAAMVRHENGKNPYSPEQIARAANLSVGDIHVYVTQSNASARDIGHEVKTQFNQWLSEHIMRAAAQVAH